METTELRSLVEQVAGVPEGCADRARLHDALVALRRLTSWCEARQVVLARALDASGADTAGELTRLTRTNARDADRVIERARTADTLPALGDALGAGEISGAHVDVVARSLANLEPELRPRLTADPEALAGLARSSTPDELAGHLRRAARRLRADAGIDVLARQRRDTRLRWWTDPATGMGRLAGWFDPLSFLRLHTALAAQVDTLRARDRLPDTCPADPLERQHHLQALALLERCTADGDRPLGPGRAELVVVVDTTQLDPASGRPRIDWGLPVELPEAVLADLAVAAVHPVVLHHGQVVAPPPREHPGRLATAEQRLVLRALHPTCVVPGCTAPFALCEVHHVRWRRHGGPTQLENLAPLCVTHHHAVHDRGWRLSLAPDRTISLTTPDGTTTTAPGRRAPPAREPP